MKENDDVDGEPIEAEDKVEEEAVARPRKTSKFMTKYERARILGTRALQIRFGFRLPDYQLYRVVDFWVPLLTVFGC